MLPKNFTPDKINFVKIISGKPTIDFELQAIESAFISPLTWSFFTAYLSPIIGKISFKSSEEF